MSNLLSSFKKQYETRHNDIEMSVEDYLKLCKNDKSAYASAAERMLAAIGEPKVFDTKDDPRFGRMFSYKKIRTYDAFKEFYGMEDTIDKIASFFKHAAQGLEESKQILYLLGPVGGGKSSLVNRIKKLMHNQPVYVLIDGETSEVSPVFDNPLNLFDPDIHGDLLEQEYNIPRRAIRSILSPWANEKLKEYNGDINKFKVRKVYPSAENQVCIAKVEPGDENNQDISVLVGKVDIRKIDEYEQNHPYAYSYSGGLNRSNRGLLDFTEMFKASIKTLNPLLEATQGHTYNGTEPIGALPYEGVILAHSNESEWQAFRNNTTNEAFLDRVFIVKVPYCLRVSEEINIYEKLLRESELSDAKCAPDTLKYLAQFGVMTRLKEPENSTLYSKMRVYDGENIKDTDPKAKPLQEYKDNAGVNEGMNGISTRFAFKVLSNVFNYDTEEVAANPVHLMYVLETALKNESLPADKLNQYLAFMKGTLTPKYAEFLEKELRVAMLESYRGFGQNVFERYITFADAWIADADYRDQNTGEMYNREVLNAELEKIEKPAGIANPKDFRNEIVMYVMRYRATHTGETPQWNSFEKIKTVIEKKLFSSTEDILPIISFTPKSTEDDQKKHDAFVERMKEKGYSTRQIQLLIDWFYRYKKNS